MTDNASAAADAGSPFTLLAAVDELVTASQQASLVRLALSSGLLARCAEPVTVTDLAAAIHAPESSVTALCTALVAAGALRRDGTGVRLSAAWLPLTQAGLDVMLEQALGGGAVRQRLIEETLSESATYWERDPVQRRALADSVTLPTTTEFGRAAALGVVAGTPGLNQMLQSGARWLELGCGVAGVLLGSVHHYPNMRAVGVDIAPDLLDVARARAQELGISDRVRLVECDARAYTDDEPFDVVFWSQFFFPRDTRKSALENAFARLRPGGLLVCPVLARDLGSPEAGSPETQRASLDAIVFGRWDIPVLSCDDLADDITAAGFADVREHRTDPVTVMLARRP